MVGIWLLSGILKVEWVTCWNRQPKQKHATEQG